MGIFHILATEYRYKEMGRHLKEQFINGLNDDGMIVEIIFKLTPVSDTSSVPSRNYLR